MNAERAGRGRAFERSLSGFDEGLLPAEIELPVALEPAAVAVDLRQVVPDAQQVRAAGLFQRGEEIAIGPLGERGEALLLDRLVEVDRAEHPVPVAAPAHDAGGAGFDVFAGMPDVGHCARVGQHARIHGRHPGEVVGRAVAQRAEGRLAVGGHGQALGQGQALDAQGRRPQRYARGHLASTMFSPASGPRSRMLRRRRCQAFQVRRGWPAETAK